MNREEKHIKNKKKLLLIGILVLLVFQVKVEAKTHCQICREVKQGLENMGYSESEVNEGLRSQGCCDCAGLCSSSSSGGSGGVCLIAPFMGLFLCCCVFIAYYGKKREIKKK